jgi:large subunit ribosomal protein L25
MADRIEFKVEKRDVTGKKVKFLRNQGFVPVHLFGHNVESQTLQGEALGLQKIISQAGRTRLIDLKVGKTQKTHSVMVREIQKDPIKGNLLHVDFYEVNMAEKIRVEVPILLIGESPALKLRENMLYQDLNNLTVECLPGSMPDRIRVDISVIKEADEAVRVKDVVIPDVHILNDPDLVIAKVSLRPVEVVEEVKPAAAAVEGAAAEGEAPAGEGAAAGEAKAAAGAAAKAEAKAEKK